MGFDPKAYAEAPIEPAFDPKAYAEAPEKPADKPSKLKSLGEGIAQAVTFGYLPEIEAGIYKMLPGDSGKTFGELRDEFAKVSDEAREANPKTFALGNIAGAVAPGVGLAKLLPAVKGASTLENVSRAAKTGAVIGGLQAPSQIEGQYDPIALGERIKGAGLGYLLGAGSQGLLEGAAKSGKWAADNLAPQLKSYASKKAFKTLGGTPTQIQKAQDLGQDEVIGRTLLDQGAVTPLSTRGQIASRVETLKAEAGERVGSLIKDTDEVVRNFTPIRIVEGKRPTVAQNEVLFTPVRFDENPMRSAMPWLKASDAPDRIVKGETQPIQAKLLSPPKNKIVRGKEVTEPIFTVNSDEIVRSIRGSADFKRLERVPGYESVKPRYEAMLETLSKNGKMSLSDAQALRQDIDAVINFSKRSSELTGNQDLLYQIRTAIRDKMNDAINSLEKVRGGPGTDALKTANTSYSNLSAAEEMLERTLSRQAGNRTVSLTDTIAATAGASDGGGLTERAIRGILFGGVNKAIRTFGTQTAAVGADRLANQLAKAPSLARLAEQNPAGLQSIVNGFASFAQGKNELKPGEVDTIIQNPQLLQIFRENPSLVDEIQDPKRRRLIQRAISTEPKKDDRNGAAMQRRLEQKR